jgi:hypothetical protein
MRRGRYKVKAQVVELKCWRMSSRKEGNQRNRSSRTQQNAERRAGGMAGVNNLWSTSEKTSSRRTTKKSTLEQLKKLDDKISV